MIKSFKVPMDSLVCEDILSHDYKNLNFLYYYFISMPGSFLVCKEHTVW